MDHMIHVQTFPCQVNQEISIDMLQRVFTKDPDIKNKFLTDIGLPITTTDEQLEEHFKVTKELDKIVNKVDYHTYLNLFPSHGDENKDINLSHLNASFQESEKSTTIVLVGHGISENTAQTLNETSSDVACKGGELRVFPNEFVSPKWLMKMILSSKKRQHHYLLILDSCYSGKWINEMTNDLLQDVIQELLLHDNKLFHMILQQSTIQDEWFTTLLHKLMIQNDELFTSWFYPTFFTMKHENPLVQIIFQKLSNDILFSKLFQKLLQTDTNLFKLILETGLEIPTLFLNHFEKIKEIVREDRDFLKNIKHDTILRTIVTNVLIQDPISEEEENVLNQIMELFKGNEKNDLFSDLLASRQTSLTIQTSCSSTETSHGYLFAQPLKMLQDDSQVEKLVAEWYVNTKNQTRHPTNWMNLLLTLQKPQYKSFGSSFSSDLYTTVNGIRLFTNSEFYTFCFRQWINKNQELRDQISTLIMTFQDYGVPERDHSVLINKIANGEIPILYAQLQKNKDKMPLLIIQVEWQSSNSISPEYYTLHIHFNATTEVDWPGKIACIYTYDGSDNGQLRTLKRIDTEIYQNNESDLIEKCKAFVNTTWSDSTIGAFMTWQTYKNPVFDAWENRKEWNQTSNDFYLPANNFRIRSREIQFKEMTYFNSIFHN